MILIFVAGVAFGLLLALGGLFGLMVWESRPWLK